jgi:hypothetical protein
MSTALGGSVRDRETQESLSKGKGTKTRRQQDLNRAYQGRESGLIFLQSTKKTLERKRAYKQTNKNSHTETMGKGSTTESGRGVGDGSRKRKRETAGLSFKSEVATSSATREREKDVERKC